MNSIGPEQDKPILRMFLAGIASIAAGGSTHPVDTVKVRLQKEGEGKSVVKKYRNILRGSYVIYCPIINQLQFLDNNFIFKSMLEIEYQLVLRIT